MRVDFDIVVIGGGMAGLNVVDVAAAAGRRVAVIERDRVGGSCPIRGCIPTKALVRSAEIAHEARRAADFGIRIPTVEVDFAAVMERVRAIIDRGATATRAWLDGLDGVELFTGEGRFAGPGEVAVGDAVLRAPTIVVATGAVPGVPPIPGLDRTPYLTSDDVLQLDRLPERLVIVGAGAIALELGQALGRLGSRVTMLEVAPRALPAEEPEFADALLERIRAEGVDLRIGVTIDRVEPDGSGGARAVLGGDAGEEQVDGDALLIATGRAPAVAGLELESAGVGGGRRGIPVDDRLRTSAPGVYAAGDVLGPPWGAFTHVAKRLGIAVAKHALGASDEPVDSDIGPHAIFTDPELASMGMTEQAARDAGFDVVVGTGAFRGGRARAWGQEHGMAKVIAERGTGRILGAHVLGYHAADLLHPLAVAVPMGPGAVDAIANTPHIHPTFGEVVKNAVIAAR